MAVRDPVATVPLGEFSDFITTLKNYIEFFLDRLRRTTYSGHIQREPQKESLLQLAESVQRGGETTEAAYRFGPFELDTVRLELWRSGELLQADALVVRLLACLVQRAGHLVTKDELVAEVWERRAIADNAITVAMARLRKLLGESDGQAKFVSTVYGRGYRFIEHVTMRRLSPRLSEPQNAVLSESDLPFVGRDRLLASLQRAYADTQAGHGRACLLIGEPGIGKTRAVEVFERQLGALVATRATPIKTAWGFCREAGDTPPLAPFLRVLRELAPNVSSDVAPVLNDVLNLFDAQSGARPENWASCRPLAGPARHHGFDALLRALALVAAESPLMLVLDDLHRADAGSLELLSHLLEEISRTKILVVATLRAEASSSERLLSRVLGHRNCERIMLSPLPEDCVKSYVAAVLDDPNGRLGDAVYAKSEGNPFFMVELSRQLGYAARPDPSALAVNDAALDLIRQRVARLDTEARGVLSAAAVIGRSFELPLLQAVCDRELPAVMASLDKALIAMVVIAAPDSSTGFAFGHELLRAVLYEALEPAARRRLHIRIAQALERRIEAGVSVPASELAHHLYAALPESDLRKTVHYCREAASAARGIDTSLTLYGNPDVVRYLRHALDALMLMKAPSVRLRTSLLLMSIVYARGCAHTEYVALLKEVMHLAREHDDAWTLVRAAYMLNPHPGLQPLPGAYDALTRALELIGDDAVEPRALGLATLALTAPVCFDQGRVEPMLRQADELGRRVGSVFSVGGALLARLYLEGGPAHWSDQDGLQAEIAHLARLHPKVLPVVPGDLALHRTVVALQMGDPAQLQSALDQMETTSRQLRHLELIWHAERWRALVAINNEPSAAALAKLDAINQRVKQFAFTTHAAFVAFDRQVVFATFGTLTPLDETQRDALVVEPHDPPPIWSLKVRALAGAGLTQAALTALRAVTPEQVLVLPCDRDYLGTLGQLTRACLALGALEYAEVLYKLLSPHSTVFAGHVAFFSDGPVSQLLGMLAMALGRQQRALEHFELALTQCEQVGLGLRGTEVRVQLAAALAQSKSHRRRAETLARDARAAAQRFGLTPLAREAQQLVEQLREP